MSFLYLLEEIRTPILDRLFLAITFCGHEIVTIAVFLAILWCVDKKHGYTMLYAGLFGMMLNLLLKAIFQVERPWVLDENFTIVEAARATANGYSFPSGHTQNSVALYGGLFVRFKNKYFRTFCVILILAIAFSRMYLGVHTPQDVLFSLLIGALPLLVMLYLFRKAENNPKVFHYLDASTLLFPIAVLIFFGCTSVSGDEKSNMFMLFGIAVGIVFIRRMDERFLRYAITGPLPRQIIKYVLGLAIVLFVLEGSKPLLVALLGDVDITRLIRYFLVTASGGTLVPLLFPLLHKTRK